VDALAGVMRARRPRVVLGFEPLRDPNYSLHGHHLAAGLAAMLAVHRAADAGAPLVGQAWMPERHWVVVPPYVRSPSLVEVQGDGASKRRAVAAHRSQRFSLARLERGLEAGQPDASLERWHLAQS